MALPVILFGAAVAATLTGIKHSHRIAKERGHVDIVPGDSAQAVKPQNGALVCCEVYSLFDHTGIWFENRIIELNGNGLIRTVSPERFLQERSGDNIFIACDQWSFPIITLGTHERAMQELYQYREYHLLKNNCHRFVWHMVSGFDEPVTRFTDLNEHLCALHDTPVSWHMLNLNTHL